MSPPRESKVCPVCGRPFTWRKKWERDWPNVRYCSKRCARGRGTPANSPPTSRGKSPERGAGPRRP
ncbi:MAG: DUF2256 domain-containing protein [Phycisphaerae bacterium]|nr:DUF2256 domain-containing protein [Phycisphaerae bacterium]